MFDLQSRRTFSCSLCVLFFLFPLCGTERSDARTTTDPQSLVSSEIGWIPTGWIGACPRKPVTLRQYPHRCSKTFRMLSVSPEA